MADQHLPTPSEFRISEKWDKCLENFTLHFTAGLVAGGLTSLVLARTLALGRYDRDRFGADWLMRVGVLQVRAAREAS